MSDKKVTPIRGPKIIAEVGGVIDESGVTLCVYGENLEPADVTKLLGVKPSQSFKRGYQRRPGAHPMRHGAWFLEVRGKDPNGPDFQLRKLLMKLPVSEKVWKELNRRYQVKLNFGLHFSGWNKGFEIDHDLVARVAKMGIEIGFDIYAYGDEEDKT